ncbi:hypothetical protein [Clostridium cuniculi]|uniref:hypothetical protein n=1 Tax=Clostridium cuniculi TaxID=2548455 RepID=UPI001055EFF2|nr:hypothetical protein [Clostridium cuniculi]
MGLFDMFNKNKNKKASRLEECFSETGELLGEIIDLASRYSIDDNLLDKYSKEGKEIVLINKVRAELESALVGFGKILDEYYNNEYVTVKDSRKENESFSYSLDALVVLFNNSLDLYSENEEVRDGLNSCYKLCNSELINVKEILSDDKAIQDFTGIEPVVEEVEEIIEENSKDDEVTAEELSEEENTALVEDDVNSDVDGDIIVNTDKMKIYFIRISRNEEDEINLNLCIENKLNNNVIVQSKDVYVDGVITEPTFSCNIKAEARVYEKMTFKNDIQQLVNFKGTFCLIDGGSTKVIDECTVSMFEE